MTTIFEPLPRGPFDVVLADCPWSYANWSSTKNGAASAAFNTLSLEQIRSLPVKYITAPNCALCLWATFPKLPEALEVIRAWGFSYVGSLFEWMKTSREPEFRPDGIWLPGKPYYGLGFYTRKNVEVCLLGKRGRIPVARHDVLSLIIARRRSHSEKPTEQYERIEALWPNKRYIELFARKQHSEKWTVWGDQAPKQQEGSPE